MIKIISLLSIILFSFTFKGAAKECNSIKDTFYVFLLQYNLENGRPVSSYFICKDLNLIDSLSVMKSQKEVLCWFYGNAIVYQEPPLGVSKFSKCDSYDKSKKQEYYSSLYKKLEKLRHYYCSIRSRQFSDVKNAIAFNCIKLYGDFWISDKETVISDQVYSDQCPHKSQEYDLKEIFQFWKLTKNEEQLIKLAVQ